jgi:integrase
MMVSYSIGVKPPRVSWSGIDRDGNFVRRVKWNESLAQAGIAHATRHDLRRTFGSLARLGGADLRYVQKAMGHASITTTSRIYAHLYDTEPDAVAEGIDRVMGEAPGPPEGLQSRL